MHGINEPKFSSMEEADGACESLPPTNGGEAAPQKRKILSLAMIILTGVAIGVVAVNSSRAKVPPTIKTQSPKAKKAKGKPFDKNASFDSQVGTNAQEMLEDGKHTFRFDTFGDEVFWGCGEGADCG